MGWEKRGNGRYYYRKRKVDGQVISEYVGRGGWVESMRYLDRAERQRRADEISRDRQYIKDFEAVYSRVSAAQETLRNMVHAALLLNGFHFHKGQVRKRNG